MSRPGFAEHVLCKHCGKPNRAHLSKDGKPRPFACPGNKWPRAPLEDSKQAFDAWDRKILAYWDERSTSFEPVW